MLDKKERLALLKLWRHKVYEKKKESESQRDAETCGRFDKKKYFITRKIFFFFKEK